MSACEHVRQAGEAYDRAARGSMMLDWRSVKLPPDRPIWPSRVRKSPAPIRVVPDVGPCRGPVIGWSGTHGPVSIGIGRPVRRRSRRGGEPDRWYRERSGRAFYEQRTGLAVVVLPADYGSASVRVRWLLAASGAVPCADDAAQSVRIEAYRRVLADPVPFVSAFGRVRCPYAPESGRTFVESVALERDRHLEREGKGGADDAR